MQRIENSVYRHILGAPTYAQVSTLRGEIGSNTMESRIRTSQVNVLKYVEENHQNQLMRRIVEEQMKLKIDDWFISETIYEGT